MIGFRTFLISCICMLPTFAFVQNINSGLNVDVIEKNIDKFPYEGMDYIASDIRMEEGTIKELNTDAYLFRRYVNRQDEEITLYIGYYGTKKGGRTGHNPSACYPGSGWSILNKSKAEVSVFIHGEERPIAVNLLQISKQGNSDRLVYHWYQSNGGVVLSSGIEQNLYRFKSRILYNRNDGAFIRVSTPITRSLSYAEKRAQSFIKQIFPLIVNYWPKEGEI